uniref:proteasome endopeptidase complex n=1 Tax=Dermatophagoides pteronyssinus TaxID=6956 RepID=A0A6P6XJP1_DERPT|nr:proteasome subunit beta type-7-like [Dermatophagoides pteronyssinus]
MAKKTGTTICGLIYDGGVVLAADTRATAGSFIADKSCFKLHLLLDHIWCAGAGVAADLEHVTMRMAADLRVFQAKLKSLVRVETAVTRLCNHLVQYMGHISVALIIGGINPDSKPSLWYVSAEGHAHQLPYLAMGSGGLFATSVLERKYRKPMPEQEAMDLAADAIEAGVINDLGSGTMVDVVKITIANPKKPVLTRGYRRPVANIPGFSKACNNDFCPEFLPAGYKGISKQYVDHIRTSTFEEIKNVNFDFIIVGGGGTGCPYARKLADEGLNVLIIERGNARIKHVLTHDMYGAGLVIADEAVSQPLKYTCGVKSHAASVLGGGTAIGMGIMILESEPYLNQIEKHGKIKIDRTLFNQSL